MVLTYDSTPMILTLTLTLLTLKVLIMVMLQPRVPIVRQSLLITGYLTVYEMWTPIKNLILLI